MKTEREREVGKTDMSWAHETGRGQHRMNGPLPRKEIWASMQKSQRRTCDIDVLCLVRLQHHVCCAQKGARVEAPHVQLVEVENTGDLAKALLELLDVGDVWADVHGCLEREARARQSKGFSVGIMYCVVGCASMHL